MKNSLFLKALRLEEVPRPPVWLMRQAGRYMPHYQALRKNHSLWEMFHRPELVVAVTCLPLEHLGVDAAILFSDILVIAEALGLSVQFPDQGGPRIVPAIHTEEQVAHLSFIPVADALKYVFESIQRIKAEIDYPLIGFSGAPFTVASYFIDSFNHASLERTKRWMCEKPGSFHALLSKITQVTIAYLQEQIKAGVDVLQVFDSWASVLDDAQFAEFSVPYLKQIAQAIAPTKVPLILFCRNSSLRAEALSAIGPSAISFDWHLSMKELRSKVPADIAVQGNFNPALLKQSQEKISSDVHSVLASMRGEKGFIVNLGHGVTPDTPFENVRYFVDLIKGA